MIARVASRALVAAFACTGHAQDVEVPPDLAIPAEAVAAGLHVAQPVVAPDAKLTVTLVCRFQRPATVSQTLLGGHYLTVFLRDRQLRDVREAVPGSAAVAAGTRLERTVVVDLARALAGEAIDGPARLTLRWPGVPGATAGALVVPDQTGIDVGALDLHKTRVRLVTDFGDIVVSFLPEKAPRHVANFVTLAKDGFYAGTRFHRILRDFMVQGGCPNTKLGAGGIPGTGDPGYRLDPEFNDEKHVRGVLSMARLSAPDSAGCQFFLMHGAEPRLDGQYTVFGRIAEGLDVLDKIANVPTRMNARGTEQSVPVDDVWLHAAVVEPAWR